MDAGALIRGIEHLNEKWTGFRYVVAASDIDEIAGAAMAAAGITQIIPPQVSIEMRTVPSLSTVKRHIPSAYSCGQLILLAPVVRNTALYRRVEEQLNALKGQEYQPFNLIIAEFGASSLVSAIPIAIWFAEGCQAVNFKAPNANANYVGEMPLEELTLQVDRFYRPILT